MGGHSMTNKHRRMDSRALPYEVKVDGAGNYYAVKTGTTEKVTPLRGTFKSTMRDISALRYNCIKNHV